ncbi:MAG: hypothetical protein ACK5HL_03605 [Bacilli bacterium]
MFKIKELFLKDRKIMVIIIIVLVIIIGGIITGITIHNNKIKARKEAEQKELEYYNSLPIKVDISMTSYYGSISYILYELDLDLVTMGANCYTGVQRNEFKTEKYGVLYTEFRYCKSNSTTIFRVYNDEKDQPLREPKKGELSEFDKYGKKIKVKDSSL